MNSEDSQAEMTRLIVRHQHQIYAFVFSLIPYRHEAEDILQETCMTICEKFSDFEQGTSFINWANAIAFWKVRQARLRFARSKLIFSDEVQSAVWQTNDSMVGELGDRHEALDRCLRKLSEKNRQLVLTRYERGQGVQSAAANSDRSLQAAYRALGRIRKTLFSCIERELAKMEGVS